MNKILLTILVAFICIQAVVIIYLSKKNLVTVLTQTKSTQTLSQNTTGIAPTPHLLSYIPVTINKIDGNTLHADFTTATGSVLNLIVTIDDKTIIYGSVLAKPVAVQTTTSTQTPIVKLKDIKPGTIVHLATNLDINDNPIKTAFTASEVRLPPIINVIRGNIQSSDSESLVVKAPIPTDPKNRNLDKSKQEPKQMSYQVHLTTLTEIYKQNGFISDLKTTYAKISLNDLSQGMTIAVYADAGITDEANITAQYIEVLQQK